MLHISTSSCYGESERNVKNSPIGRADANSIDCGCVEVVCGGEPSCEIGTSFDAAYILSSCCVTMIVNSVSDVVDWLRTLATCNRCSNERYHGVS